MMDKMEHEPIADKDMSEAKGLVAKLQALAKKCDCSMEHLIEMASDEQGMESEDEGEDMGENEGEEAPMSAGPNRGKIALIIAKMKKAKGE